MSTAPLGARLFRFLSIGASAALIVLMATSDITISAKPICDSPKYTKSQFCPTKQMFAMDEGSDHEQEEVNCDGIFFDCDTERDGCIGTLDKPTASKKAECEAAGRTCKCKCPKYHAAECGD
jgi:hypothetical protein